MCGVSGIINFNRDEPDYYLDVIKKINLDLSHRGPNNSDIWRDKKNFCYLGHTRLSIIDLSKKANQPMIDDENEYVISFNGEIYNYLELRKLLISHGIKFKTNSDTEVLLNGFKYFGKNFLLNVDGMFVFAIYDIKKERLFIYRDRAGEKPLYYVSTSKLFIFSSELKPLLRFYQKINYSICEQSIFDYLALRYVPKESTIVNQIKKLEAGNFIELSKENGLKISRYFSFSVTPEEYPSKKKLVDFAEKTLFNLKKSIKRRLNSDVPLGTFLSGGIDSTITSAIIAKDFNINLNTFSVGFENYKNSEHNTAIETSRQIGTIHNEIIIKESDVKNVMKKIGDLMDDLNGDRSFIPMYIISKYAKKFVTVVLSGDGADELFGGYPRHWFLENQYYKKFDSYNTKKLVNLYFENFLPVFKISKLKELNPLMYENFSDRFSRHYINNYRSIAASTRELDFNSYLTCVLSKVDNMSMKCSLEVRTPFLSTELLFLSMLAPDQLLFNGTYPKLILRNICSKYTTNKTAMLPKTGFGLPIQNYEFFQSKAVKYFEDSVAILKKNNFFSSNPLLLNFFKNNYRQNTNSQWALIVLAKWLDSLIIDL